MHTNQRLCIAIIQWIMLVYQWPSTKSGYHSDFWIFFFFFPNLFIIIVGFSTLKLAQLLLEWVRTLIFLFFIIYTLSIRHVREHNQFIYANGRVTFELFMEGSALAIKDRWLGWFKAFKCMGPFKLRNATKFDIIYTCALCCFLIIQYCTTIIQNHYSFIESFPRLSSKSFLLLLLFYIYIYIFLIFNFFFSFFLNCLVEGKGDKSY